MKRLLVLPLALLLFTLSAAAQTLQTQTKISDSIRSRIEAALQERLGDKVSPADLARLIEEEVQRQAEIDHEREKEMRRFLYGLEQERQARMAKGVAMTTAVNVQDSLALVALYNSTNGPGWTNNTNWLAGPVSTWFGVTVENGRVVSLDLTYNGLVGQLPSALGNLSALRVLRFYDNRLNGLIPSDLGSLAQLEWLYIDQNELTGMIPESLGNLSHLKRLYISRNRLSGNVPPALGNLANLELLYLCDNQLSGSIPRELGGLSHLSKMTVEYNLFTGSIPSEFGGLNSLQELSLSNNQFSGFIPREIGNLSNLKGLRLEWNQFSGTLPVELGGLSALQLCLLSHNQFSGTLPSEFGMLGELQVLDFAYNQFSGAIPPQLENLRQLYSLKLGNNQFGGQVPAFIGNMRLDELDLKGNRFNELPLFPVLRASLNFLYLEENGLTFEDIEPYIGIYRLTYAPQDSVVIDGPTQLYIGESFSVTASVGGSANQYHWYWGGPWDWGGTYQFSSSSPTWSFVTGGSGSFMYRCEITNPNVPGLRLYSKKRYLKIVAEQCIAVDPEQMTFQASGQVMPVEQDLVVFNIGSELLTISDIQIIGKDSLSFVPPHVTLPIAISGKRQALFKIGYLPQAPGQHEAMLRIRSNCAYRPELDVPLTGQWSPDTLAPGLVQAFPAPGAQAVPPNAELHWRVRDGVGLNLSSVDVSVNGASIVTGGEDQTGGQAQVRGSGKEVQIQYRPLEGLPAQSEVVVHLIAEDIAATPNVLDTTYVFRVGGQLTSQSQVDTVGAAGGTVVNDSLAVEMVIPANALTDTTAIVISRVDNPPALPDTVSGLGLNLHFWPDGLQFNEPVTLRVPYTQAMLDSAGVEDPINLSVYYFSSTSGEWTRLTVVQTTETHFWVEVHEFCYLTLGRAREVSTKVSDKDAMPGSFLLEQNYPNPFNPETHIAFATAAPGRVLLGIYDVSGRKVRQLVDEVMPGGWHDAFWQGTDDAGQRVANGVYFYVLQWGDRVIRKKCVFLK